LPNLIGFYSFEQIGIGTYLVVEYYIRGDSSYANHHAVALATQLSLEVPKTSSYKMNSFYFKDTKVESTLQRIWKQKLNIGFMAKLKRSTKFYKIYSIKKLKERQEWEANLHMVLVVA